MKKVIASLALCVMVVSAAQAQKYVTRTGNISFYSSTPLEEIKAVNNQVTAVVNSTTGDIAFAVPIKSFKFERQLMEEHFNENYMESGKYPKAEFKGKLADPKSVNYTKDGTYDVNCTGKMTMHGVTKDITVPGTITVKGSRLILQAKFNVTPQDYNINIPGVVKDKIAKTIAITVNSALELMK